MTFINYDDSIGMLFQMVTDNLTGSEFLTILLIVLFLMGLTMAFRMPLEFSIVAVLPILLVSVFYVSNIFIVFGIGLIYLAIILGKKFFLN